MHVRFCLTVDFFKLIYAVIYHYGSQFKDGKGGKRSLILRFEN